MNHRNRPSSKDNNITKLMYLDNTFSDGVVDRTNIDEEFVAPLIRSNFVRVDRGGFIITENGYSMLQRWYALEATRELKKTMTQIDESNSKVNNQMLEQTKSTKILTDKMTDLTKWILGFTIINVLLILVQLGFMLFGGK
jgi:hypothetical protein